MSPRPKKLRNCCPSRQPEDLVFKPAGTPMSKLEILSLAVDELEAISLCDGEGLTQQEAGEKMGISRGTVQRLVTNGRRKIVEAILQGKALEIHIPETDADEEPGC
ncbi:Predicted DNA-binding protein, UPF0251 family [Malonomonas rubra DSM 5091]|uniref:UPF0251 protein SAMN02745165_02399 n=1 Tax=Malonomonas rubra DSM 5091 TaxID=1122189 RepID=A0A1M6JCX7_MALRU|nr:DUF134 domain-containing protein [Malonomonas rubra]SHJ44549.1 Predicted DNA-binding protein, UPF0251 family [Malonomonas rubra DSM 5091]